MIRSSRKASAPIILFSSRRSAIDVPEEHPKPTPVSVHHPGVNCRSGLPSPGRVSVDVTVGRKTKWSVAEAGRRQAKDRKKRQEREREREERRKREGEKNIEREIERRRRRDKRGAQYR